MGTDRIFAHEHCGFHQGAGPFCALKPSLLECCPGYTRNVSHSSSALKARMARATAQARMVVKRELLKMPILPLSLVNRTSGITANGSWKLSTTWLRINSEVT